MLYFFSKHKKALKDKSLFLQETINWFLKGRKDLLSGVSALDNSPHVYEKQLSIDKVAECVVEEKKLVETKLSFFTKELNFVTHIKSVLEHIRNTLSDPKQVRQLALEYGVDFYAFCRSVSKYQEYEETFFRLEVNGGYLKDLFTVNIADYIGEEDKKLLDISKPSSGSSFDDSLFAKSVEYFTDASVFMKNLDQTSINNSLYYLAEILNWIEDKKRYWNQVYGYCKSLKTLIDISKENINASCIPITEQNVDQLVDSLSSKIYHRGYEAVNSQFNLSYTKVGILTE